MHIVKYMQLTTVRAATTTVTTDSVFAIVQYVTETRTAPTAMMKTAAVRSWVDRLWWACLHIYRPTNIGASMQLCKIVFAVYF